MNQETLLRAFQNADAMMEGHFLLKSDRCSSHYINVDRLWENAIHTARASCYEIARRFQGCGIDIVLGPANGGNLIAAYVADYLHVKYIPTGKDQQKIIYVDEAYFESLRNAKVLIVDDMFTRGTAGRQLVTSIYRIGAGVCVVGFAVFWNRGTCETFTMRGVRVPITSIISMPIEDWSQPCPLCKADMPFTEKN